MSNAAVEDPEPPSRKPGLIVALVLALAGAGGGYYAASSGLLPLGGASGDGAGTAAPAKTSQNTNSAAVAFVDLPPVLISLDAASGPRHLRFHAQLEVAPEHVDEVTAKTPRIIDVMNSYLRALSISELQDSLALPRLRSQLLRRLMIVTGDDRARDLLVMEFVLN